MIEDISLLETARKHFDWKNLAESLLAWTLAQTREYRVTEANGHIYGQMLSQPDSLLWAFLDRGHTACELLAELHSVWPRICNGGVLAGHGYGQRNWREVAPTIDFWVAELGLELHVVHPFSFWVQRPGGQTPLFRIWNQEIPLRTSEDVTFNPSICEHPSDPGKRIFAFRSVRGGWERGRIWAVVVDSVNCGLLSPPLELDLEHADINCEDPRLFLLDSRVWLGYTASKWSSGSTVSRQHLVLLRESDSDRWEPSMEPVRYPSPDHRAQEKNWIFFRQEPRAIFVLYEYSPQWIIHRVCTRSPESITERVVAPGLFWPYGEIRGGTPFIRAPNGHWWTFFHSSSEHDPSSMPEPVSYYNGFLPQDICRRLCPSQTAVAALQVHGRYFCGLLEIHRETLLPIRIVRQPLLYEFDPGPGRCGAHVVWPAGAFLQGDEITIAYGRDDRTSHCCRFSARLLDELLFPVNS